MLRILFGLLAVLFYSSPSNAFDENPVDWVAPKSDSTTKYSCFSSRTSQVAPSKLISSECLTWLVEQATTDLRTFSNLTTSAPAWNGDMSAFADEYICNLNDECYTQPSAGIGNLSGMEQSDSKICPPDDAPDYIIGPTTAPDGTEDVCLPQFEKCPLGFFANSVTSSNGEKQCVPIQCPDHGTESQFFNHNNSIPLGVSGTYCDSKCAYSISSSQGVSYQGSRFATGTSLGSVCGQGSQANDTFFQDDSDGNTCEQHSLSSGSTYLTCEGESAPIEETPEPGEEIETITEGTEVDPSIQPEEFTPNDCVIDGSEIVCVGQNITDSLDHQNKEIKKSADERHNKMVKLQKDLSEYIETKQNERASNESTQSSQETQMIVTAIQGISSGSGTGDGEELKLDLSDLIEDFDSTETLNSIDNSLSQSSQDLEQAQTNLDNEVTNALSKFGVNDSTWTTFKSIPNYLPSDAVCTPFELGLEPNTLTLDLCEYNEIIKKAIAFMFAIATCLRLFYQTQRIVKNVALAQG